MFICLLLNSPLGHLSFCFLSLPSSEELFDPGIYYKDSNGKPYKLNAAYSYVYRERLDIHKQQLNSQHNIVLIQQVCIYGFLINWLLSKRLNLSILIYLFHSVGKSFQIYVSFLFGLCSSTITSVLLMVLHWNRTVFYNTSYCTWC